MRVWCRNCGSGFLTANDGPGSFPPLCPACSPRLPLFPRKAAAETYDVPAVPEPPPEPEPDSPVKRARRTRTPP